MHPKIQTVASLTSKNGVKCIIYGAAGSGKTRLCGSVPSPLILSAERGLLSLRAQFPNLPAWEINTMADLIEAHRYVLGSAEARMFHTVCVDSASDIAEVLLAHEKQVNTDKRNQFKPYANLADQFMQIMRDFRSLQQKHVYFICKEERDKDENGMMMYQPSMPGRQLTMQIPYLVDEIFRLVQYTDPTLGPQLAIQCYGTAIAIAKDRSGALAPYEPYNLGAIFDKIMAA